MNDTLKYKYVKLPQIKLKLKNTPIGTIALKYTRPVILTDFRPSRSLVVRAMICVMMVAKTRCHEVRRIGYSFGIVSKAAEGQCWAYRRTEPQGGKNPFVEQDNTGTQGNPYSAGKRKISRYSRKYRESISQKDLHHVKSRVDSTGCRLCELLNCRIDGWEHWSIDSSSGGLARDADLFFSHCDCRGRCRGRI